MAALPLLAYFTLLRDRAPGKAWICLLGAVFLLTIGLGVFRPLRTGGDRQDLSEFSSTLSALNKALHVHGALNRRAALSSNSESTSDPTIEFYRIALTHAEAVDPASLNERLAGLGDHFQNELLVGLRLVVEGKESGSTSRSSEGRKLLAAWLLWHHQTLE